MKLGERLSGRDNALNLVRLVLASLVVFSHTPPIAGIPANVQIGEKPLGEWAVAGFFALSGYLIAGSRVRLSFLAYLWRRALRILPAFWVSLLAVGFLFAPLVGSWSGGHWRLAEAVDFVVRNAGLRIYQWTIGDTLGADAFQAWNGSLWTLFYEFGAYVVAGVLLSVGLVRRNSVAVFGTLVVVLPVFYQLARGPLDISTNLYLNALWLGGFFVAGMFMWAVGDRVASDWRLASAALAILLVSAGIAKFLLLGPLPLAYLLLYLGGVIPWHVGAVNDISYGMYVYAFPMQQVLAAAGFAFLGFWGFALLAIIGTVPLAWLSWKLVEQPAMRYRSLVPNTHASLSTADSSGG